MCSTVAGYPSEKLVELYQNDPALREKAYGILCERYDPIVFKRIRKHLFFKGYLGLSYVEVQEEARGLTQEFLDKKFRKVLEKYDPQKGDLNKWINECVKNFVISFLRGQPKQIESFQIEEEGKIHSSKNAVEPDLPYTQIDNRDTLRIISEIVQSLPAIDQKIFELRYRKYKKQKEIAKALGLSTSTVSRRLRKIENYIIKEIKRRRLDEELR